MKTRRDYMRGRRAMRAGVLLEFIKRYRFLRGRRCLLRAPLLRLYRGTCTRADLAILEASMDSTIIESVAHAMCHIDEQLLQVSREFSAMTESIARMAAASQEQALTHHELFMKKFLALDIVNTGQVH